MTFGPPCTYNKEENVCSHVTYDTGLLIRFIIKMTSGTYLKYWNHTIKHETRCIVTGNKEDPSYRKSNQCEKRSVKIMQKLYAACRNKDKLRLWFILRNEQWWILYIHIRKLYIKSFTNSIDAYIKIHTIYAVTYEKFDLFISGDLFSNI